MLPSCLLQLVTSRGVQAIVIDVREAYPKDGQEMVHSRRDLRGGTISGSFVAREDGLPSVACGLFLSDPLISTYLSTLPLSLIACPTPPRCCHIRGKAADADANVSGCSVKWSDPAAGTSTDVWQLRNGGKELVQRSTYTRDSTGQKFECTAVYTKV